ncbi:MAG: DegT/DnrJ/EryC1/StrS family aminotransferase [Anaerolineae bacterium]
MTDWIPFDRPDIGEDEIAAIAEVLRSGWLTTGPRTQQFEQRFAHYVGAQHALAVNSCTAAMEVALAAWGIGPGDEVITSPLTFCSSVHVILHRGARPVLADVCLDDYTLDPGEVAEKITPRTRVLLPVHLAGLPCQMDRLLSLARAHGLKILEDAAHAAGARVGERMIGSIGHATAFSFYATKNLTTAEGGMLTSDDESFLAQARLWSLHGLSRDAWKRYTAEGSWQYDVVLPGLKCNMTDLQAALGLAQLAKLERNIARRAEIARRYTAAFSRIPELIPAPEARPGDRHARHLYLLRLNLERLRINRDRFLKELQTRGIGTSVHFIPIYHFTYYRERFGWRAEEFPVSEAVYRSVLSLPCYPRLTDEQVDRVITAVSEIVEMHQI